MRTLIFLAMLVLCPMLPLLCGAMLATGTVNGSVVDSAGKAVPNQKVRIRKVFEQGPVGKIAMAASDNSSGTTVTTDKEGKFTQTLEPGSYWAEAGSKALGYAKVRFDVKAGETTDVKLTLAKEDGKN
jgi:uncharacterized GH25 family protein